MRILLPLLAPLSRWLRPRAALRHDRHGALATLLRERAKSGTREHLGRTRVGPNRVHAWIARADGSVEDLGVSKNLLTNAGRDVWANMWGYKLGSIGSPATATSAASLTATGTPWPTSGLGLAGLRIYADSGAGAPVYGNICSNTSSAATVDKWWNGDDSTASTPSSTAAFTISPGGITAFRFVALSTDAAVPSASDTTLASEVTASGGARATGVFAHTGGTGTLTLTVNYTFTGTLTGIYKAGLFPALPTSPGSEPLLYETALNADMTVASGDSATLTWTFTLSG